MRNVKRYFKYIFVRGVRILPILYCLMMLVTTLELAYSLSTHRYILDIALECKVLFIPISTMFDSISDIAIIAMWFLMALALEMCWRYKAVLCYVGLELAYRHFFGDYVFGADSIMPYVLMVSRIVICSSLLFMIIKFWIDGRTTSVKGDS